MISEVVDGLIPNLMKRRTLQGPASRTRDGVHFMDLNLATIRYRVVGNGDKTVVFVTDPPIVIEHYDGLVDVLKQDSKVVIFEPPGFGFSIPSLRFDYRFNSLVGLVETFLEKLALGPVTFVGPCVLGYCAIGVAQKRPDLIERLILNQVPSWAEILKWKFGRDPKGMLGVPVLGQLLLKALKEQRTPAWFKAATGNPALVDRFNKTAQEAYGHGAIFNLASGFQRFLLKASPLPDTLSTKTLFLWGERDHSHCQTCKDSSLQLAPHADLIRIPEAGHFIELEKPELFAAHLQRFT